MMSVLPDELWRRIMEIGIDTKILDYRGLCCLSITCRRLRRLAVDDSVWSMLLCADFDNSREDFDAKIRQNIMIGNGASTSTADVCLKNLYRIRYEKNREQRRLTHRRAVLRIESEIAENFRKIKEIGLQLSEERERMNLAITELRSLHRVRHASTALNVWQPEVIRARQKQVIQQCNVPVEFRINALEMELGVCKRQISGYENALNIEKGRLNEAKKRMEIVKYHPLQDTNTERFRPNEPINRSKKLKLAATLKS